MVNDDDYERAMADLARDRASGRYDPDPMPVVPAGTWQPAETAPRRRRLLAYGTVPEREGVLAETNLWIAYRWPEGWGGLDGQKIIVTHWQPLPEPPQ